MNIKNFKRLMLALFALIFSESCLFAKDSTESEKKDTTAKKAKTIADAAQDDYIEYKVNGKTIRHSEVEKVFAQAVQATERSKMQDEQIMNYKKYISDMLIANILIREQSEKTHIDRDKDFRKAMQKYKDSLMVTFYIQKFLNDRIQQAALFAKVKLLKADFATKKEKKVCFIITQNEENAKKAIEDIKAGKRFVETANLYSSIPNAKAKEQAANGVYMPVLENMPMLPAEISLAINNLQKGEFTKEPTKAGNDYYVIKIEDERPLQISDEALTKIAYQQLRAEELKNLINNLIQTADIVKMDEKGQELPFEKKPINPEGLING